MQDIDQGCPKLPYGCARTNTNKKIARTHVTISFSISIVCTEKNETLQFILKVFGEENTCHFITHFNDL